MTVHKNLAKITEGKEELMQQAILDYLLSKPTCSFSAAKFNLPLIIDHLFDYLDFANRPEFSDNKEFQGDTVKDGMVVNLITSFKALFVDTRNQLGKVNLDTIKKEVLLDVYDRLHSGMESFGVLVALRNGFFKKVEPGKIYTLGAYANDITSRLMNRCRFNEEGTMIMLKLLINAGMTYRNAKDHSNADKSYLWTHIYDMLMFMCASVYIGFLLSRSQNGGVRYETTVNGKLVFHYKDKSVTRITTGLEKYSPQFIPIYQFNLPEKWQKDFDCRIDFFSLDNVLLDSHRFDVKDRNFCTFKYTPKIESTELNIHTLKTSVPKVMTTVNKNLLKGQPFLEGSFIGSVDGNKLPHGKGTYQVSSSNYDGLFEHGKPVGIFTVHCNDSEDPYMYVGTLSEEFLPIEGFMKYLNEEKTFEGTFDGWALTNGKKSRSGKLIYEGEFQVISGENNVHYNLYHGKGKLYGEDFVYEGEFSFGEIDGEGVMTYADTNRPPVKGLWSQGILLKADPEQPVIKEPSSGVVNEVPASNQNEDKDVIEKEIKTESNVKQTDEPVDVAVSGTVLVLLNLPDDPMRIQDSKGNEIHIENDAASIELPIGMKVSATLLSDERAIVYYQAPDEENLLEQWNIAEDMEKVLSELPVIVGKGIIELEDGSQYQGEWNKHKHPHGQGVLHMKSGQVYTGEFKDGKFDGIGKLEMPRQTYTGGFKRGLYHGLGITVQNSGDKLEGTYENGVKDGVFTLTTARGMVRKTIWSNGELIS